MRSLRLTPRAPSATRRKTSPGDPVLLPRALRAVTATIQFESLAEDAQLPPFGERIDAAIHARVYAAVAVLQPNRSRSLSGFDGRGENSAG